MLRLTEEMLRWVDSLLHYICFDIIGQLAYLFIILLGHFD